MYILQCRYCVDTVDTVDANYKQLGGNCSGVTANNSILPVHQAPCSGGYKCGVKTASDDCGGYGEMAVGRSCLASSFSS